MAYRRDNQAFREHIARKATDARLSWWQVVIIGLAVNAVKGYAMLRRVF